MVPHVLIVDANPSAAQVTCAMVARAMPQATVEIAPTIECALLTVARQPPDALFIDPSPHTPAAAQLIAELKAAYPNARVIVIASMPTPALRRTMEGLGVDAYLEKPALLPLLQHELHALLENSAAAT
jgi:DNA-binding NarL/FixJ family response regulator